MQEKNSKIRIYHLSDIHVRKTVRHAEYQEVFDKVYDVLDHDKRSGYEHAIIVVTGDIFHTKIDLSPESEMITLRFFQQLALRFPTYVIAGNHDALLNNRERIDSLTSLFYDRDIPNLFYLKNTGVYPVNIFETEIRLHVFSLLDEASDDASHVSDWYVNSVMESKSTSSKEALDIALFHGGIGQYRLQNGMMQQSSIPKTTFECYDGVMLGDIHLHQFLTPKMAYAGSLVSQNSGESDPHHGILVWDFEDSGLPNKKWKLSTHYKDIFNRFAYSNVMVSEVTSDSTSTTDNDNDDTETKLRLHWNGVSRVLSSSICSTSSYPPPSSIKGFETFPTCGRIRVFPVDSAQEIIDTDISTKRRWMKILQKCFPEATWTIPPSSSTIFSPLHKVDLDLDQDENQNPLVSTVSTVSTPTRRRLAGMTGMWSEWMSEPRRFLENYLKILYEKMSVEERKTMTVSDEILKTFEHQSLKYFHSTRGDDKHQAPWRVLRMEWDHLFGYGPGQSIDFSEMKKQDFRTMGIFGPNSSGKSTLIDILSFLLFNKITRWAHGISIPSEVIHSASNKASGTIWVEMAGNGAVYRIVKKLSRAVKTGKITLKVEVYESSGSSEKQERAVHLEQKRQTDSLLQKQMGTFEDFLFLSVCLQRMDKSSLRDMTQKERKDWFFHHLHLEFMEKTLCEDWEKEVQEATKEILRLESRLQMMEEESESTYGNDMDIQTHISSARTERKTVQENIQDIESKLSEIHRTMVETSNRKKEMERLMDKITDIEKKIQTTQDEEHRWGTLCSFDDSFLHQPQDSSQDLWTPELKEEKALLTRRLMTEDDSTNINFQCLADSSSFWKALHKEIHSEITSKEVFLSLPKCPLQTYTHTDASAPCSTCLERRKEWGHQIDRINHLKKSIKVTVLDQSTNITRSNTSSIIPSIITEEEWFRDCMKKMRQQDHNPTWDFPIDFDSPNTYFSVHQLLLSHTSSPDDLSRELLSLDQLVSEIESIHRDEVVPKEEEMDKLKRKLERMETTDRKVDYNLDCDACRKNPFRLQHVEEEEERERCRSAVVLLKKEKKDVEEKILEKILHHPFSLPSSINKTFPMTSIVTSLKTWKKEREGERVVVMNQGKWLEWYRERLEILVGDRERKYHEFLEESERDGGERWDQYQKILRKRERRKKDQGRLMELEEMFSKNERKTTIKRWLECRERVLEMRNDKAGLQEQRRCLLQRETDHDALERQSVQYVSQKKQWEMDMMRLDGQLVRWETTLERRKETRERRKKEENILGEKRRRKTVLEFLTKRVFHRDGFPLYMLRKFIGEFESHLESIIEPFFHSKKLRLVMDETGNAIHLRVENADGTVLPNLFLGGMEGLMADVAMKVVWNMVSSQPRCNLFVLDENISVLDQDHLHNLRHIFEFLEEHFDHILVISHLDIVKDFTHINLHTSTNSHNYRSLSYSTPQIQIQNI